MKVQEVFRIVIPTGLYNLLHVPQGVLNATGYVQAILTQLLEGLDCGVPVNHVVIERDPTELFDTLDAILERLEDGGLS